MAIITASTSLVAQIGRMSWGQRRNDVASRSIFGAQALEVAAPLWLVDLSVTPLRETLSGEWQATLLKLKGQTNQLELWNLMRPAPLGTMRGTMTLNAGAAQGATSLAITAGAGQAGTTLLQGDLLQLGSGATQQVVMITADATANGSGVISAAIEPPLRNAFASAASVTWDKPKALFRRTNSDASWDYSRALASGFALSLIEDWRP